MRPCPDAYILWMREDFSLMGWFGLFHPKQNGDSFDLSIYHKMFGLEVEEFEHGNATDFSFLYLKFYIHRCKFQAYKFKKIKINSEYKIAESKAKLSKH